MKRLYEALPRAHGLILFGVELVAPHAVHGDVDKRIPAFFRNDFIVYVHRHGGGIEQMIILRLSRNVEREIELCIG